MICACELTTARLRLVPCNDEHLVGLNALNSDPEVMRYLTGRTETLAETRTMIARVQARWANWGYSWWTFIARRSGEGGVAMAEFAFVRLGAARRTGI